MTSAQEELERFLNRRTTLFAEAVDNLVRSKFAAYDYNSALAEMAELIQKTQIIANLNGRRRVLLQADRLPARVAFADTADTPITSIPFEEAIENLITRDPRLAEGWRAVAQLYNTEHAFALARSVDQVVTNRVQDAIAQAMRTGQGSVEPEVIIQTLGDWDRAYASTVYRTNANTAYTEGRFEQAKDPEVAEVVPAMEFVSLLDGRTRPNHAAAHGLIAATDDPIWNRFAPPIGFQCRCGAELVSVFDLEDRGLIRSGKVLRYLPPTFSRAHPDEGFDPRGW